MNTGALTTRRISAAACVDLTPAGFQSEGIVSKVAGALGAPLFVLTKAVATLGAILALGTIAFLYALNELRLRRRLGVNYEGPCED